MPSFVSPALAAGTFAGSAQPEIRGDGVLLRPWRETDRAAVVAGYADPAIQQWHCRTMTPEEAAAWIAAWPHRWRSETGAGWAVVDTGELSPPDGGAASGPENYGSAGSDGGGSAASDSGRAVGQISFRRIDLDGGSAEISYWVLPGSRGRRIAPRALSALTNWAFTDLGLHRLELNHSTANTASCRVATRAGFPAEGTKRAEARHADGWHDMHQHARLATD
ncbi:GNAT family N-acetyltransferase [Actinoplanes siamensis]|uniref:Acetyltransferase n=1 Tax=Actinoplanes siamensis TaxID=1223317 RepID=A0A919N8C0_9ACTN|nr:GNAT family N-acetyltransferase [Actinoplanes siamensis]GIF06327.1 acetyltransferase [Actinoplanes siamensis]